MAGTIARYIGNYDDPESLGTRFRRKRSMPLMELVEHCYKEKGSVRILDVGGVENYWNIIEPAWLTQRNVKITLSNLTDDIFPIRRPDLFDAQDGDGCALPYADGSFDICHSNSTIEHVGNWARKVAFAQECKRVASHYFVQTPNFWFPWEPHFGLPFYHWLPDPSKLWLSRHYALGWNTRARDVAAGMKQVEYASMLNRAMMDYLFPEAEIRVERFAGLTKSFTAISRPT